MRGWGSVPEQQWPERDPGLPVPLLTQHKAQSEEGHRQSYTPHDTGHSSPQGAVLVQQLLWLE